MLTALLTLPAIVILATIVTLIIVELHTRATLRRIAKCHADLAAEERQIDMLIAAKRAAR